MPSALELERNSPSPPQTYTTSGLLLREIYEYLSDHHLASLPLKELADEVFFTIMRAKYGSGLYDATLTNDGRVYSSGLANDVAILIAAGYARLTPGKQLELTSTGRERAEDTQPPPVADSTSTG